MKNKTKPPVNLEQFFKMFNPNEVPELVHFCDKDKEHTNAFYQKLSKKISYVNISSKADIPTVIFFIVLLAFFSSSVHLTHGFWGGFGLSVLASAFFWVFYGGFSFMYYQHRIVSLAKDVRTYVPKPDFISAHSQFLLQYVTELGKKNTSSGNLSEVISFGVKLAEIPGSLFEKDEPSYYRKAVEVYWRALSKQLNEFGNGESVYEDFSVIVEESLVEKGKISFPGILKEVQELVGAWRKHQKILVTFSPVHDFFILFDSLDRVILCCLLKKQKDLTTELQELDVQLAQVIKGR